MIYERTRGTWYAWSRVVALLSLSLSLALKPQALGWFTVDRHLHSTLVKLLTCQSICPHPPHFQQTRMDQVARAGWYEHEGADCKHFWRTKFRENSLFYYSNSTTSCAYTRIVQDLWSDKGFAIKIY